MSTDRLSRRTFLGVGAAVAAGTLLPARVLEAASASALTNIAADRSLSFIHTHTGEQLTADYCLSGDYLPDALDHVNHLLRDFRVNVVKPIDPKLLDRDVHLL